MRDRWIAPEAGVKLLLPPALGEGATRLAPTDGECAHPCWAGVVEPSDDPAHHEAEGPSRDPLAGHALSLGPVLYQVNYPGRADQM